MIYMQEQLCLLAANDFTYMHDTSKSSNTQAVDCMMTTEVPHLENCQSHNFWGKRDGYTNDN